MKENWHMTFSSFEIGGVRVNWSLAQIAMPQSPWGTLILYQDVCEQYCRNNHQYYSLRLGILRYDGLSGIMCGVTTIRNIKKYISVTVRILDRASSLPLPAPHPYIHPLHAHPYTFCWGSLNYQAIKTPDKMGHLIWSENMQSLV